MDARRFSKGHGCPFEKFPNGLRTRSAAGAEGARTGCAFFWLLFFAQAKKSDSRPQGVKAFDLYPDQMDEQELQASARLSSPFGGRVTFFACAKKRFTAAEG
ncbi:hypothetical protein KV692_17215 [Xanthomonas euvesicatoria pv. physalidis]|uniref:hypothetical protein n=1 Tax=Xanthomonas euvesicatoria TaxID=456327 RepID=UPI001C4705C8|nr:hypothetical protein [Xanthomonas euvesicatoria]MBV6689558.1 hypothetical protein [Xanthomonas euvesicatoria pv. physalidis]